MVRYTQAFVLLPPKITRNIIQSFNLSLHVVVLISSTETIVKFLVSVISTYLIVHAYIYIRTRAETNIQIVWVFARLWQYSNPHWIFKFKTFDIMQIYVCTFAIFINAHRFWCDTCVLWRNSRVLSGSFLI